MGRIEPGDLYRLAPEVAEALEADEAVVALESTVIAHGLPWPRNLETALAMEKTVREGGAIPATIAVVEGIPYIGLSHTHLERIARTEGVAKLSTRDLALAIARRSTGATTVAATAHLAHRSGICVFATGGIGGVHRGDMFDVSADLIQLQRTPIVTVCAGAKSILDLERTRELLESLGVLVLGWQTEGFPAFYTAESGLKADARVDSALEVGAIWHASRRARLDSAMLLCVPVPEAFAIPAEEMDVAVSAALDLAAIMEIRGKNITPFLLGEIGRITAGSSIEANVALLGRNAEVAASVAVEIASS